MKRIHMKRFMVMVLTLASILSLFSVSAQELTAAAVSGLSVRAKIPENQIDKKQTYFDLLVEPGQKQTIQLEVVNSSDKDIVANVSLNAASTERNGLIVYDKAGIRDESMELAITDVAAIVKPQITIPANQSKMVDVEINMPAQEFKGTILGGLYVTAENGALEETVISEGVQLNNSYAYVVGLKLTQSDNVTEPHLNLKNIQPDLNNYRTSLFVNLQNSEAVIMKGVEITAEIYKANSDEILKQAAKSNVEIAPNSSFDYTIDWDSEAIAAGDYRLRMKAVYGDYEWVWDELFTITSSAAGDVNHNAVGVEKNTAVWVYLILIAAIVLIIFFIAYYLGRRTGHRMEQD